MVQQSSIYFKLWVRDGEVGSNWVEIPSFVDMEFKKTASGVGWFKCAAYTADSVLQPLLTGNRIFRITNAASDDGTCVNWSNGQATGEAGAAADSWEIMTGRLRSAVLDQKTRNIRGSTNPVLYYLEGFSFVMSLDPLNYEADNVRSAETAKTTLTHIATTVGSSKVVFYASSDTGPTIKTHLRKMSVLRLVREIARIGDATDDFSYYLEVVHNTSFVPVIRYLSPTNAIFETSDPFGGGRDEGRVLEADRELRSFNVYKDRERVKNRVIVRYGGTPGGAQVADSTPATDSTFPESREVIIRSPMMQDATTADQYAETIKEMYKGTAEGFEWAEAALRTAELFSGDFDAVLGDQVGIEDTREGTEVFQGKFLKFHYTGKTEEMVITLGLPRPESMETEAIDRLDGETVQTAASSEVSESPARACRARRASAQTLTTGSVAAIDFNAEDFDTDAFHDNSTNPSRFTAPVDGYYVVTAGLEFVSDATSRRAIIIRKQGTTQIAEHMVNANADDATILSVSTIVQLDSGEYVEILGFQNSGGDLDVTADGRGTRCEIALVGTT